MTMEELYDEMKMALKILNVRFSEMDQVNMVIEDGRITYYQGTIGVSFDHEEQN